MKCLYFDGTLHYQTGRNRPERLADQALIRVRYAGICNTDREIMKGYKGFHGILGHEFVGVVEDSPDSFLLGKRVVADINIACGSCVVCRQGLPHHCRQRQVLGITGKDGCFADYITLPSQNLYIVPDNVDDLEAVFAEPLAAALEILEQVHVRPLQRVAVLGDGKLGQLVAQVLCLTGCDLTVIGKHQEKLQLLSTKIKTLLVKQLDNREYLYDIVVDCTGNPAGLNLAQSLARPQGTVVLKSTFHGDNEVNLTSWVVQELTVVGSRCGPIPSALRLLERRLVDVKPLISGVYPLADWEQALKQEGIKVIFSLNDA